MAWLKPSLISALAILLPAVAVARPAAAEPPADDESADAMDEGDGSEMPDDSGDDLSGSDASDEPADTDDDEPDDRDGLEPGEVPKQPKKRSISGEYRWDAHLLEYFTFGVGFIGQFGGNFIAKPDDQTVPGAADADPEYPGFAGLTSGFGPTIEVRFLGYVGVELDILFQTDTGSAELKYSETTGAQTTSTKWDVEISQKAVHLPLLFKGAIPGKIVTPLVFLGPEFVIPSSAEATTSIDNPPNGVTYGASEDSYTAFTFGLGMEFNLQIPYVDIRIPITLRGNVNPGLPDKRAELADYAVVSSDIRGVTYHTEWQYQAVGNFGVAGHF